MFMARSLGSQYLSRIDRGGSSRWKEAGNRSDAQYRYDGNRKRRRIVSAHAEQ